MKLLQGSQIALLLLSTKTNVQAPTGIGDLAYQKHVVNTRLSNNRRGPGWLNELGSWITEQPIQAYHQYGVGSRPAL